MPAGCYAGDPFVITCLKEQNNPPWIPWLQAHFIFSATLNLSKVLPVSHKAKKRYEANLRFMKHHILCHLITCLQGVSGLAGCIKSTVRWSLHQTLHQTPKENRLVMVPHMGSRPQWILVTQEKNKFCCLECYLQY